jgi:colanic acid biosynthesis glycosyl transferase WcaI
MRLRRGILQLTYFMPRVIFLNRFFHPDYSATSRMLSDLAFELASSGKDVHVITSRQLYDKPGAELPAYENTHGVHIHRVGTTRFGRSRLPGRAMDYLSFYFTSWRCALSITRPDDVIVAKTDPPMISLVGMAAAKQRKAKLINWVQDVYPEIAVEFGVPFLTAPVRRFLFWLRDMSLKAATTNVVLGQLPARLILSRGVPADGVTIIHNWSDEDGIVPIAAGDNPLRQRWGLGDKFVVGYSGNLGRTHEFLTMLSASERFRNDERIVFLVIGGGHQNDGLAHEVKTRGLERSYLFAPYQDAAALKYSLGVPDVHWISLRPQFEGLIVPSKFYGIAAAGRPMISIGSKKGELGLLVEQHQCGFAIEEGDVDSLEGAINILLDDHDLCTEMGQRARAMLDHHFTRRQAFGCWQALISKVEMNQPK